MAGRWSRISAVAAFLLVGATVAPAHHANAGSVKIRMAFSTWTGYSALVVGVNKGIFSKYGLDVSYSVVEDPTARRAALQSNRLDGAATTVDTFTRWAALGVSIVQVFGIDKSEGGDGIVSKKSITNVQQLKGKTVAVNIGSTSEWFLNYVLQKNGMTVNDIKVKDMPDSGVAGQTFVAGKVDAAVTWQPWLDRAAKASFGHILVSSAKYPNIIVDDFGFTSSFIKAHPDAVTSFIKAYFAAVTYVKTNAKDAYPVIGKYTGETNSQVAGDFATVPLMDLAASKAYFGTSGKPGPIYDISRQAATFWVSIKKIKQAPDFNQIIDASYQEKVM